MTLHKSIRSNDVEGKGRKEWRGVLENAAMEQWLNDPACVCVYLSVANSGWLGWSIFADVTGASH